MRYKEYSKGQLEELADKLNSDFDSERLEKAKLIDVYDVGDYRKIILPMFVIRRLDAVLEDKHQAVVEKKKELLELGLTDNLDEALFQVVGQAFVNKSGITLKDLKSITSRKRLKDDFTA